MLGDFAASRFTLNLWTSGIPQPGTQPKQTLQWMAQAAQPTLPPDRAALPRTTA
ncbi:hypothetical protein GCM10010302_06690 [Streptomyces polychromogenes]|uniref:Uncharacterized protein n=1 Tax=Streptomyces polychromogenes TaxID=67342 RepID=A0ABP3ENQ5_9ACTN